MPVQTRSSGDQPSTKKVTYTSAPPVSKQKHFPPRRRQIKTYGRPRSARRMQQGTLTQMNFVSPEVEHIDLDDDEEDEGDIADIQEVKKPKSKPAKDNRRKTLGDEFELAEKPSSSNRANKRRRTMGDTPSMPASSSFHTQTLTQFLSSKDEDEENWQINDSDADEDAGLIMETPRKAREGQSSKDLDPKLSGKQSDQAPNSQHSKVATPTNRKMRTEIPSSESPAITPMLMRYSPLGSRNSPLTGKSTNAEAPSPIIRSIHKRPRDMVIQDTYSTTQSSPNAGTPTPKATVKFSTPKKLRFDIPEDKENITPGRTKPKSPKPLRKTPGRQPLREVPDSDAEDEESLANFDSDLSTELGESESTDALPESPTPMGRIEEPETCYGLLGDETQAEILSSDHFQDRDIEPGGLTSTPALVSAAEEVPTQLIPDRLTLGDHEPKSPTTPVIEQSPTPSPQVQTPDENSAPLMTQGHAFTQFTQDLESQRLPLEDIHALGPQTLRSDIMVSLHPEHLSKVVDGTKNHEFRVWKIPSEVYRVWLYATKPISELRYMCIFGPPKEPGQLEDESGVGNKAFNQGKTVNKYAYEVMQVYELNDPVSLQEMIRKGWVKGAPQKYNYIPPAVVGELTANLRCALFGEVEEEDDDAGTPRPGGSKSNVTESQEIRAQLQSDAAYSTQHPSSELAEEVIPSSQTAPKSSSKRRSTGQETQVFARPAIPKASSSGAGALESQGLSGGYRASQRQQNQQQNSIIRASQATTVTQMSSSPAVSPEKSSSSLRGRRGRGVGGGHNHHDAIITLSSEASPEQPLLPQHNSSPATVAERRSSGGGGRHQHNSLGSSQFLTRSQMLPDSLLNDETREPPPIIWDSADEQSD